MTTIAYQGEPGSNSAAAVQDLYPGSRELPCTSFEQALDAVTLGTADLAVIPMDNSAAGRVADVHHLLPESGLSIIAEYFLAIHFDLMGVPGASLEQPAASTSRSKGTPTRPGSPSPWRNCASSRPKRASSAYTRRIPTASGNACGDRHRLGVLTREARTDRTTAPGATAGRPLLRGLPEVASLVVRLPGGGPRET
ncbi:prephenate dehydratase domain-containing protein [Kitasatospora sp. NPDC018058]|uniref:prephenate dehydratase domain-containing protein n=1 Tax=Kitasatospora sp. NPDC018058 TaxID=3364025 RepID=UPI0037C15ED9